MSRRSNRDNENNRNGIAAPARRALIFGGAAAGVGMLLAPGIRLIEIARATDDQGSAGSITSVAPATRAPGTAASSKIRWGMLIDTTQCRSDCAECVNACNTENHLSGNTQPTDSQWIRKIDLKDRSTGKQTSLPMMCQHCADAPCVDVCPTSASFKRADGIVLVDRHRCIGCRYCMMACPYKARSFVHETVTDQNPEVPRGKGCVEGCTLCVQRIDKGLLPACVEACPRQAILFGDLNDPDSPLSQRIRNIATTQVRADLKLDPGIRYYGI